MSSSITMSKSSNATSASLTACPSCGGSFTATGAQQPLIITCGDTFCRRCVQDLTDTCGTLVCPVCGEVNEEEEGGGGPTEYSVNRLALSLISTNTNSNNASASKEIPDNFPAENFNQTQHVRSHSAVERQRSPNKLHPSRPLTAGGGGAEPLLVAPAVPRPDVCGACGRDFTSGKDELQHCPHCGLAVCGVCKGEHRMLVLDRLHASRVQIQERLEDTRFSQQYKRETLSQLKLQGEAEQEKIRSAMEKAKLLATEELDKRKDFLLKEVSNYVTNTVVTLESQLAQCSEAVGDVETRLEKVNSGAFGNETLPPNQSSDQPNNEDLLQLCQTQITYGRCLKTLENCTKDQPEVKAIMLKFSDSSDSVNLLNIISKYGSLKGSAALETNLKAAEELFAKSMGQNENSMQTKRLHRYRTIVGGTPLNYLNYKHAINSSDSGEVPGNKQSNKVVTEFMCILKDDRVVVSCSEESSLFIWDKNLETKETVRIEQFASLKGIAATNSKLVLLLRNSLELYSTDILRVSGKFFGSTELANPVSLAASHSRIFVYDQDRERSLHYITIFDNQGRYVSKKFVGEARCDLSATVSVVKGKTLEETLLVVGSCKSVFLRVLNSTGELLWEFNLDEPKIQGRKWRPHDTAVDNEGNFLVLDSSGRKVLVFNKEGKLCGQFDPFSTKTGQASKLAVNSEGQIVLLESNQGKLLIF